MGGRVIAYNYEGETDLKSKAAGWGRAKFIESGDVVVGTFWNNDLEGVMTKTDVKGNKAIYEVRKGCEAGLRTAYNADGTIHNSYWSMTC